MFYFIHVNYILHYFTIVFFYRIVMANIFTLENISDFSEKINLDDLYEKKR